MFVDLHNINIFVLSLSINSIDKITIKVFFGRVLNLDSLYQLLFV